MNKLSILFLLVAILASVSAKNSNSADSSSADTLAPSGGGTNNDYLDDGDFDSTSAPSDSSDSASKDSKESKDSKDSSDEGKKNAASNSNSKDSSDDTDMPSDTMLPSDTMVPTEAGTEAKMLTMAPTELTAVPTELTAVPTELTMVPTDDESEAPSTEVPTTQVPVVETVAPTEAATEAATEMEPRSFEMTQGPTDAATVDETEPPTEAPTEKSDSSDSSDAEEQCEDNEETRWVYVDLQLGRDAADFACTGMEEAQVAAAISEALNTAFPATVPEWDGAFLMGDLDFDDTELVDSVSERRLLRGSIIAAAKAMGRRRLAKECEARLDTIECATGYCMWGCGEAVTTNCGDYDSTDNWAEMHTMAAFKVKDLGFACLGDLDQLKVTITLEHGEEEETRTFKAPTASPTMTPFEDIGHEIEVTTSLKFQYFGRNGGDLDPNSEIALEFIEEFNIFQEGILMDSAIGEYFNGMAEGSLTTSWDEATRILTMHFHSIIYVLDHSNEETDHDLARIMVSGNFHDFLQQLRQHECGHHEDQSACAQYMTGVHQVIFQATGTGRR